MKNQESLCFIINVCIRLSMKNKKSPKISRIKKAIATGGNAIAGLGAGLYVADYYSLDEMVKQGIIHNSEDLSEIIPYAGPYIESGIEIFAKSGIPGYTCVLMFGLFCAGACKKIGLPSRVFGYGARVVLT